MDDGEVIGAPYGYCQCGCGERTNVARQTDRAVGRVRGEPLAYRLGHSTRRQKQYEVRDEGYETPCWIWLGEQVQRHKAPYGRAWWNNKRIMAHRLMYERHVGPIPEGLQIDHLCRVTLCVNPSHLEPVTGTENLRRGPRTKLNPAVVSEMRRRWEAGETQSSLAREFGVTRSTIRSAVYRRTWKDVE